MIVNSARAFIPISDLSVTVKTGDISGEGTEAGDRLVTLAQRRTQCAVSDREPEQVR